MQRSGSSILIVIFVLVVAGLALFDQQFQSGDAPAPEVPAGDSSSQNENNPASPQNFPSNAVTCYWRDGDNLVGLPGAATLSGCAQGLFDRIQAYNLDEVYGTWRGDPLYVQDDGDVYTAADDSSEWNYEGTLDVGSDVETDANEQPQSPPSQSTRVPSQPSQPLSLEEVFVLVERDLNDYWSIRFREENARYIQPDIILYDRSRTDTACGTVSARMGPLYCPADHTAYFPYNFMLDQMQSVGDFAVAVIIAHEWGHAVQTMGNLNPGDQTIFYELQADCFAGAYSRYASLDSSNVVLEEGDLEEGARALFLFGDPEGTPWFDEQAHGSGNQRYNAYEEGLQEGYDTCLVFE